MTKYDETYVREILEHLPAGLTPLQFRALCKPDMNAGYTNEVTEAEARYFKPNPSR